MGRGSQSCGAFGMWGARFPVVHGMFSVALSGCIGEFGTCGLWALRSPPWVTRFGGGRVDEICLYLLGNVRNEGMKRCCYKLSGNGIDVRRERV